jgi:hypothetical protein
VLRCIGNWLGEKFRGRENVQPAGPPSVEPLEPRLFLNRCAVPSTPLADGVPARTGSSHDLGQRDLTASGFSACDHRLVLANGPIGHLSVRAVGGTRRRGRTVFTKGTEGLSRMMPAVGIRLLVQRMTYCLETLPVEIRGPPSCRVCTG